MEPICKIPTFNFGCADDVPVRLKMMTMISPVKRTRNANPLLDLLMFIFPSPFLMAGYSSAIFSDPK
jgi:hypothetical protein